MPENKLADEMNPEAVAAANEAAHNALENQGREDLHSNPTADSIEATTNSLDALAKKHDEDAVAKAKEKEDIDPVVVATPDPKPGDAPVVPPPKPDDAHVKLADTIFKDSPSLPANASPRSTEAFFKVKLHAAQEISARETKMAEMQKQIDDLVEKSKNPTPPEVEKELKENREWRAKLDVESDPKFKEHTKGILSAQEFIYSQLKKGGLADDLLEKIKGHGGPENVDLTRVFEKGGPAGGPMDAVTRRLVESKVADIEQMKFNREQAIKDAKANIGEYIKAQETERTKGATAHNDVTRAEFTKLSAELEWLRPVKAEKNDEASKKVAEEHNAFVEKTRKDMETALLDDSAEMRAIMIMGMGQLFHTKRQLAEINAKHEASEKALKEATDKLAKYMNASRSKLPESAASTTPLPASAPKVDYSQSAGESLDAIARRITEERTRNANQPQA